MSNPSQFMPVSTKSYGYQFYRGRIEAIRDGKKEKADNHTQVRVFGYQDDQSNMPNEILEWITTIQARNSNQPGHGSTIPYLPGTDVLVMDTGLQRVIIGSWVGYDKAAWLNQKQGGLGDTENKRPDVPDPQTPNADGGEMQSRIRSSQSEGINQGKHNEYPNYQSWKSLKKNMMKIAVGEEHPAPYSKGTKAILSDLKSIAIDKLKHSSDILDVIKQLDNNQSGAIQKAIEIIKNLRNNGYGTGMATIGAGNVAAADAQVNGTFGSIAQANALPSLLQALLDAIRFITSLTGSNLMQSLDEIVSIIALLSDPSFGIAPSSLAAIQAVVDDLQVTNQTPQFYDIKAKEIQGMFAPLFMTAIASIFNDINSISNLSQSDLDLIESFGGPDTMASTAESLTTVASAVGIPIEVVDSLARKLMGQARKGQLKGSGSGSQSQASMLMNFFIGNPVAIQEILSGQLLTKFLTNNPIKYERVKRNEGWKKAGGPLKRFPDDRKEKSIPMPYPNPQKIGNAYLDTDPNRNVG